MILYYFSKAFQKCKISTSTVSSIFIYFSFDNRYQNWLRKFGGSVVNQFILSNKFEIEKRTFFYQSNEYIIKLRFKHFQNAKIGCKRKITIFKGKFNLCNAHNPIASFNISFFLVHYSNICNMLLETNAPAHREQHLLKDSD